MHISLVGFVAGPSR